MIKPFIHAKTSARRFGGRPEDYQAIHDFFDQTKEHVADMRHRSILHNSWGIYMCEKYFGINITNSDGNLVSVRDVGEQHVLDDLGRIPSLSECLEGMPVSDLLGARERKIRIIPLVD